MNKTIITCAVLLLLAILVTLPIPLQYMQAHEGAANRYPHATKDIRPDIALIPEDSAGRNAAPHDYEKHPCHKPVGEENRIECSDMWQQFRMALGTETMANTSVFQTYIGTWQLLISALVAIFVAFTFWETKRAAKAAEDAALASKDAANAAFKANETQREIGEAQVRAYLTTTIEMKIFPENKFKIVVKCKNFGQSPAKYVSVFLTFRMTQLGGEGRQANRIEGTNFPLHYKFGDIPAGVEDSQGEDSFVTFMSTNYGDEAAAFTQWQNDGAVGMPPTTIEPVPATNLHTVGDGRGTMAIFAEDVFGKQIEEVRSVDLRFKPNPHFDDAEIIVETAEVSDPRQAEFSANEFRYRYWGYNPRFRDQYYAEMERREKAGTL